MRNPLAQGLLLFLVLLFALANALRSTASEAERFHRLLAEEWDYEMREFPERATRIGYPGQDDRWTDHSLEAHAARHRHLQELLKTLESIDRSKLDAADQLNYDLFRFQKRVSLEKFEFPNHLVQISGPDPSLFAQAPARTVRDYENMLARLKSIPRLVDQVLELMALGRAEGVVPAKVTLRDEPERMELLLKKPLEESPFLVAFRKFPDSIPQTDQARVKERAHQIVKEAVLPAYRKQYEYLTKTYIPSARESISWRDLPDGDSWYAQLARHHTTTNLTPKQFHEIGLDEVRRIRAEMQKVKSQSGFEGTLAEFFDFMRTDPQLFFTGADELLAAYRNIAKRADPELVKLFGRLPRLPYGVVPVPDYMAVGGVAAYYRAGSLQAGRPGEFAVNTSNMHARPKWEMESLTLHEAVPGHHLQIAIQQELEGLPEFRLHTGYLAFSEGWALYAESLGQEMGFYTGPYSKFGQLTNEMWRAIRLVVDTGLHQFGWTRQQAIDFFKQNTPKPEHDITVEVDRYIGSPGQALAYKIGELKIKELRARASRELGERFDLRAFHDEVLGEGALPLEILEARVTAWVESQ
jgi:uncharacterized protein (DUF885 family)